MERRSARIPIPDARLWKEARNDRPGKVWIARPKRLQAHATHLHRNEEEYNNFFKPKLATFIIYYK